MWRAGQLALLTIGLVACAGLISRKVQAPAAEPRPPKILWAATNGTPDALGTRENPLDLGTALSDDGPVRQGDTLWVRGGIYRGAFRSSLEGTDAAPIIVRQAPGERAVIDSGNTRKDALAVGGSHTWFWGLELTSSDPQRQSAEAGSWPADLHRGYGGETRAPAIRFINLVVHDNAGGLGIWSESVGSDAYGNIIYNNGWQGPDRAHGHGIYTQNQTGERRLTDNIVFNQFSHGIHAYGSGEAYLDNIALEGNIVFNNGALAASPEYERNVLVGGGRLATNPRLDGNVTYFSDVKSSGQNNVGYSAGCSNFRVVNNYFVGGQPMILNCKDGLFATNTLQGDFQAELKERYPANDYLTSSPTGTRVVIRPNKCETGRAHIAIVNWDLLPRVTVDLSAIGLAVGARFAVRNAEDYFGKPVVEGTFNGKPISLPMEGLGAAPPVGVAAPARPPGSRQFAAFVVVPAETSAEAVPAIPASCGPAAAPSRTTSGFSFSEWLNGLRGAR
jgi:hypothetical protein